MIKKRFKVTLTLLFHVSLFLGCSAFGFSVCWMKTRGITTGRHAHKRQNTHKSSCTLYTYSYTHYKFTHPAAHPQLPTYLFFFFALSHTLTWLLKKKTLLKELCRMSMLMCWQWILLQRRAVLLNPNCPGTERIPSQALTAVMLQRCYFNNFLSHPYAHPLCTLASSFPLLSHFLKLYSLSTPLSCLISFLNQAFLLRTLHRFSLSLFSLCSLCSIYLFVIYEFR